MWKAILRSVADGREWGVEARGLVNAAGPWVSSFLENAVQGQGRHHVRQIKGSHIVVPKLFDHDFAYIFQNVDKRIVFALPFESDFTLVGTTDVEHQGDPAESHIDDAEVRYLCDVCNRYFQKQTTPGDVVWSYSGVRPLFDGGESEASEISRDYALELEASEQRPALLSVYGGKLTTYRRLAERALETLEHLLPSLGPAWTASSALPGGSLPRGGMDELLEELETGHPHLPAGLLERLVARHGSLTARVLDGAVGARGTGLHFGADLHAFEVDYFVQREWARSAEDILWRRTKSGLGIDAAGARALAEYLEQRLGKCP